MKNFYQVALLCLWLSEDWGRSEAGLPVLSQGFQYYWAKNVNVVKSNWQIVSCLVEENRCWSPKLQVASQIEYFKVGIWLDFALSASTSVGKRLQLCHWFEPLSQMHLTHFCVISPNGNHTFAQPAPIAIWHICGFKHSVDWCHQKHNFSWCAHS